jgi:hypothetical protein
MSTPYPNNALNYIKANPVFTANEGTTAAQQQVHVRNGGFVPDKWSTLDPAWYRRQLEAALHEGERFYTKWEALDPELLRNHVNYDLD